MQVAEFSLPIDSAGLVVPSSYVKLLGEGVMYKTISLPGAVAKK